VLVHEATFLEEERDRARETAHSTALEAAELAREAEVGLLALTHLSNRYFGPKWPARRVRSSPETVVPRDFDVIDVPFPERGAPRPRQVRGGPPARGARADRGAGGRFVSGLVQVALAENVAEAEELQEILRAAGIDAELETAVEHHPRETEDAPQKVLVQESELEAAQHAIESLSDPDDLIADA
jgi:hypothetical protein